MLMIKVIQSTVVNVDPVRTCTGISYAIDHHSVSFTKRFLLDYNPPRDDD